MQLVILGGLGFIFSHVTEYFLKRGWEVFVYDNLSTGSHPELIPVFNERYPNFHFEEEDAGSFLLPAKIQHINPEYIIHAAAISDVDFSIENPIETLQKNNDATVNAFEAARRCSNLKKFLYVSTDEVYGECGHPKQEDEILFPKNPYALSKAFGSLMRIAYDNTYPELRDRTVESRFCNVFGPRQDDRKVLPAIKRALNGGAPVALHNDGKGYREWIHVLDIPPAVELLLEKGSRTYNITTEAGIDVANMIKYIEESNSCVIPTTPGERRGMDMKYQMSAGRMHQEFGWWPKIDVRKAILDYMKS